MWACLNGEIYNYPALRSRLLARGHQLKTGTDTEVLVHLYEDYGSQLVHALEGFFAHASPGGPNLSARVRAARYIGAGTRRWGLGENLGIGSGAAAAPLSMLRTWMASSPHRANVLHGRFRELGTGLIAGLPTGGGGLTYTTDFGFRRR